MSGTTWKVLSKVGLILSFIFLFSLPGQAQDTAPAYDADQQLINTANQITGACLGSPFQTGCPGMGTDSEIVLEAKQAPSVTTNQYDPNTNIGKLAQQYNDHYGTFGGFDKALSVLCSQGQATSGDGGKILSIGYNACQDLSRIQNATAGLQVPGAGQTYKCVTCFIITNLVDLGNRYERLIWTGSDPGTNGGSGQAGFAALTAQAARSMLLLTLILLFARMMIVPASTADKLMPFARAIGISMLVALILGMPAGGRLVFSLLFDLLQSTAMAIAGYVLNLAHTSGTWTAMGGVAGVDYKSIGWSNDFCSWIASGGECLTADYANLWGQAEMSLLPLIQFLGQKMTLTSVLDGSVIGALILAAPYVFVLGVFGAFLIQSSFYFLAMTIAFPIAFMASIHPAFKGYQQAVLRIMLTGALTIVMAGIALGFTSYIINIGLSSLASDLAANAGGNFNVVENIANSMNGTQTTGAINSVLNSLPIVSGNLLLMGQSSYWAVFLIGFVSILLHLAAPRLAANIGGASDSAASAAAVVGAGMFAGAKAMGIMRTLGMGTGENKSGGLLGGLAQRGALGSMAYGPAHLMGRAGGRMLNAFKDASNPNQKKG